MVREVRKLESRRESELVISYSLHAVNIETGDKLMIRSDSPFSWKTKDTINVLDGSIQQRIE